MPPPNKPGPGKRRIRKRKRRQASSSSSSSSSSSDSESDSQNAQKAITSPTAIPTAPAEDRSEQSSLSDSDSTSSASDTESVPDAVDARMQSPPQTGMGSPQNRSPSPPSPTIHPLVTLNPTTDEEKQRDAQLREKFRKYWMASVADAFKDDLEKIQKVGCPFPDI